MTLATISRTETDRINDELIRLEDEFQRARNQLLDALVPLRQAVVNLQQQGYDFGFRAQWESEVAAARAIYTPAYNAAYDQIEALRQERNRKQDEIQFAFVR